MSATVDVQQHPDHRPPFPPPPMHPALPLLGHQPGPLQRQLHPTVAEQEAVLLPKLFVKMPHTEIKILLPVQGQHALHYRKRYPPRRRLPGAPVVETVVTIGPVPVIQPPQLPRTQPQYLGGLKPMNLLADGPQNHFLYFHRPLHGDPGVNHPGNLPECGLHPAASQKRTFHMLIKRTYHVLTTVPRETSCILAHRLLDSRRAGNIGSNYRRCKPKGWSRQDDNCRQSCRVSCFRRTAHSSHRL